MQLNGLEKYCELTRGEKEWKAIWSNQEKQDKKGEMKIKNKYEINGIKSTTSVMVVHGNQHNFPPEDRGY